MKNKNLWIILSIILVLAVMGFFLFPIQKNPGEYDVFAQCITDSGLIMYGTEWCPHCQAQKKLFGKSFEFVDYIDCDRNRETCLIEGIQGYPTWKFEGESYSGTRELSNLAEITGCEF